FSNRSAVAGLSDSTCWRTASDRLRCPCRSSVGDQLVQERHQSLATDSVGRRPRVRQSFLNLLPIVRRSRTSDRLGQLNRTEEQPNSVLAVVTGDRDELVEDYRALPMPGGSIARCDPVDGAAETDADSADVELQRWPRTGAMHAQGLLEEAWLQATLPAPAFVSDEKRSQVGANGRRGA